MSNFNNKYNVGSASLAEPFFDYCHTLPLVAFGDVKSGVELSLVFNSNIKDENHFNIGSGFKLNLQKKLLINGSTVKLLDSNGIKVDCNHATNQTAQYATVYALNDNSHRILRKNTDCYELEYADFSKEIFDTTGKITNLFDKYGEEMMRYVYNANGLLESVLYRPGVSETYKVLSFVYDSSSQLASISFVAAGTTLVVGEFVRSDNDFLIKHYSGVDYDCVVTSTGSIHSYTVMSKTRGNDVVDEHSKIIGCHKFENDDKIWISEMNYLEIVNETTYVCSLMSESNEPEILDITDFNGIKTRIQYENKQPRYVYEIDDGDTPITFVDGMFKGKVSIQGVGGIGGVTSPESGYKLEKAVGGLLYTYDTGDDDTTTDYTGDAVLCGWVKSTSAGHTHIALAGIIRPINILQANEWQYFAIPFYNESQTLSFVADINADFKDVHVVFSGKHIQNDIAYLESTTLSNKLDLSKIVFENEINGHIASGKLQVTFDDILRYYIAVHKYGRTNEFYYNGGRNLITNVEQIQIRYEYERDDHEIVTEFYYLDDFDKLTRSVVSQNMVKPETYTFDENSEDAFMTVTRLVPLTNKITMKYDRNMDLTEKVDTYSIIIISTDYLMEKYNRNALGLVINHTVNGNATKTYQYDDNCTKLLSMTDEFGTIVNYTTDDVWGVTTKVSLPSLTETNSSYTDDGTDLTKCTFGIGEEGTVNNISYAHGNVSSMTSGGINYGFGYTQGDLTSISKNGNALKNISYSNDYKTVSVTTPTSSSASYTKTAVTDDYGREISISGCRQNTYALYPYFTESGAHQDYGDGKGSNSLKTSTDLVTGRVTQYGMVNDEQSRIVTKNGASVVSTTNIKKDISGRTTEKTFTSTTTGEIKDQFAYLTFEGSWDTDNRISNSQYSIGGTLAVETETSFNGYKYLTSKKSTINDIDFGTNITYNKSRVQRVQNSVDGPVVSDVSYTYDALGRIVGETDDKTDKSKSYVYDSVGRLVRENNEELNKTYTYEYDVAGNITSKKTYAYTTGSLPSSASATETLVYNSSHPDRLTTYAGKSITYDQQGCPISYDGKTFTWTRGKLTKISKGTSISFDPNRPVIKALELNLGAENWEFTYNGNGQRTQQKYIYTPPTTGQVAAGTLTNQTTNYTYDHSGRLVAEISSLSFRNGSSQSHEIKYLYDCNTIVGMVHNGTAYYFMRNIQGDVVGVYNSTGTKVVTFKYDAFGRCTVGGDTVLAQWCRIRYRGYYYDTRTGLYWVQTRYYNPDWCRWISPDNVSYLDPETPHGINLYAYCANDPVNRFDPTGCAWDWNTCWDWINTVAGFFNPFSKLTGAGAIIAAAADGRWDDIVSDFNNGCLNPFNRDADTALKAKVVGFYKGSTIVIQNQGELSILGTLWLKDCSTKTTLYHEYGHSVQERILGPNYLFNIALPSLIYCAYFNTLKKPQYINYYSMPWERTADWLGGVDRSKTIGYKKNSLGWAIAENLLGPIVVPFYFLFGY